MADAARQIAALSRDRFDDAEWRKIGLPDGNLEALSAQAVQYANTLDH